MAGAVAGEGWGVELGGELMEGSGIRKKNIERESSDQTALIRGEGRGGVLL